MGGGSWCGERIGQSRSYTGFSRSASSPVLAKVLIHTHYIYGISSAELPHWYATMDIRGRPAVPAGERDDRP